jgi:hypothetical protein
LPFSALLAGGGFGGGLVFRHTAHQLVYSVLNVPRRQMLHRIVATIVL